MIKSVFQQSFESLIADKNSSFTQALEKKNGEHFHRRKIFLDVPEKAQGRFKYVYANLIPTCCLSF